jgi:hypothetical protein
MRCDKRKRLLIFITEVLNLLENFDLGFIP